MPGRPGHLAVSFRVNFVLVLTEPFDCVVDQVHLGRVKANLRSELVELLLANISLQGIGDVVAFATEDELLAAIWSEVNLHPEFGGFLRTS